MKNWYYTRASQGNKHPGSKRAPFRGPKHGKESYNRADGSEGYHHHRVDPYQVTVALEAIIDGRKEAADNQDDNAEIIQLVSKFGNRMRVIGNSVVGCRHSKAGRSRKEEGSEGDDV